MLNLTIISATLMAVKACDMKLCVHKQKNTFPVGKITHYDTKTSRACFYFAREKQNRTSHVS